MADRRVVASFVDVGRRSLTDGEGGTLTYYVGVMRSDVAKALTFVPVFEQAKSSYLNEVVGEAEDEGYQRPGSRTRMGHFATFLRGSPLSVIPAVVLSGRDQWEFEPSEANESLGVIHCYGPAAIIDGQHRVGGFVALYESDEDDRPVEFVMVPGLSLEAETKLFLDINTNQRNVVAGLTAVLGATEEASIGRAILDREDSPFCGRIAIAVRRPGHLFTMNAITRNVGRTFSHGAFEETRLDDKVEIMIDYWTRIADAFPEEWADAARRGVKGEEQQFKLCETTGLIAFSLAAQDILAPAYDPDSRTVNWAQVENSLSRLAPALDLRKNGNFEGLTGEVGGGRIHRRIQLRLASNSGAEGEDDLLEED